MTKTPIQEIYLPYFFQLFFKINKIVKEVSNNISSENEKSTKFHFIKAETEIYNEIKIFMENNIDYPILSKQTLYDTDRNNLNKFWLVNLLNNFDYFMKKDKDLSVEISFIVDKVSVAGFVYFPFTDELYFGMKNFGAYKVESLTLKIREVVEKKVQELSVKLPIYESSDFLVLDKEKEDSIVFVKSLMKDCSFSGEIYLQGARKYVAILEGSAGVFLNVEPSLEWDTSASHALLKEVNKNILVEETKEELLYNKSPYLNPPVLIM